MTENITISAAEIVTILAVEGIEARVVGPADLPAHRVHNLESARAGSVTFFIGEDPLAVAGLRECVLICLPGVPAHESVARVETAHPKLAFYIAIQKFGPDPAKPGIHATALVDPRARIHPDASVGPYCVLGKCEVGKGAVIMSQVSIYDDTTVGADVLIEPSSVIGATGQIYAWGLDGKRWVMPQLGGTVIEDGCYIGSNVSIVRGALQDTILKKGCRIAHGTMIGHNCCIGRETFLSSRVAVAGSTTIGDNCFIGSSAVFRPGIRIGDDITVGAGSVVTKDFVEPGLVLVGVPARIVKKIQAGTQVSGVPVVMATPKQLDRKD